MRLKHLFGTYETLNYLFLPENMGMIQKKRIITERLRIYSERKIIQSPHQSGFTAVRNNGPCYLFQNKIKKAQVIKESVMEVSFHGLGEGIMDQMIYNKSLNKDVYDRSWYSSAVSLVQYLVLNLTRCLHHTVII